MTKLKAVFLHLLIVSLYISFVLAIRPVQQTFEFDYDEGLNLIKALLYSRGYSLYTEIWSDQPPLSTVLLSYWMRLFGQSVFAARLLILLFSALLIWSFYQILRNSLGKIPALYGTLLLFTSWLFVRVSISVMIGIPCLALAMLSIYILTLYKKHYHQYLLIFSGILLALSLQIKLITLFLIPLLLFYLADFKLRNKVKELLVAAILWLSTILVIYLLIGFSYHSLNYESLVEAHTNQPVQAEIINYRSSEYLRFLFTQDYDYLLLACVGVLAVVLRKQRQGIFPLTWLVTATLLLLKHKPIWYHHYTLLAIPIAWLGAYGFAFVLDLFPAGWYFNFKQNLPKVIFPCLLVGLLIYLMIAIPATYQTKPEKDATIMQLVLKYRNSTHWVFTDRPIYAFYANLPVPPEIAVMSRKRFNSGNLTLDSLFKVLQTYQPEQIVLARWTQLIRSDSKISAYINQNYIKTYENDEGTSAHYVLKKS